MKKIRLPEYDSFENAYNEDVDFVQFRDYNFGNFVVAIGDETDYLYGFISYSSYYDDAIVKTEDFKIKKRTKENLKRIYEKIIKQLNSKYIEWVNSLYIQE